MMKVYFIIIICVIIAVVVFVSFTDTNIEKILECVVFTDLIYGSSIKKAIININNCFFALPLGLEPRTL